MLNQALPPLSRKQEKEKEAQLLGSAVLLSCHFFAEQANEALVPWLVTAQGSSVNQTHNAQHTRIAETKTKEGGKLLALLLRQ